MNTTAIDYFISAHSYIPSPAGGGAGQLTPLKSVLDILMLIGGVFVIVAYFYLWNKSGIRIMGQTYHEACYTKPYVCENYRNGYCDWCKVHDEREVHKLKQIYFFLLGWADDVGLVDKGYEDTGINRGMVAQIAILFLVSVFFGNYQYQLSDNIISLSINYKYLSPMIRFLINLTSAVGVAFLLFSVWFAVCFIRYQFFRIEEYSKAKYGYNIYKDEE